MVKKLIFIQDFVFFLCLYGAYFKSGFLFSVQFNSEHAENPLNRWKVRVFAMSKRNYCQIRRAVSECLYIG